MREVLSELMAWWEAGETVGVGTVVATFQSAPRPAGASMLVGPDETAVGSVSGGCVEGAVYELAQSVVGSGVPVLERYGVSDDDAFAVGLTCGGILDVYVEKVDQQTFPELGEVAADVEAGRPVALATVIEHPDPDRLGRRMVIRPDPAGGIVPNETARRSAPKWVRMVWDYPPSTGPAASDPSGRTPRCTTTRSGCSRPGTTRRSPTGPTGSGAARGCGSSCGPSRPSRGCWSSAPSTSRPPWPGSAPSSATTSPSATPARCSRPPPASPRPTRSSSTGRTATSRAEQQAGRVDQRTVITVLTHDPKFDVPLLEVALRLPEVAYVGAMGSRRTHDDRMARLREAGLGEEELARLSSPIGLDLGARTPEETAISIAAEVIAGRWGGSGEPLGALDGRIHR